MNNVMDIKIGELPGSNTGFQATQLAKAVEVIKLMKKENALVLLSFTSNMVASGLRGIFAELCEKKFVDVIITAGGSIDHDLIRSYDDYLVGDFSMDDSALHKKGINRIGNILVPNERYELLEEKMKPIFEKLYAECNPCSASEMAKEIGLAIGNDKKAKKETSFLYWAAKNGIPVYCPGITDSAIGLQTYFFKQRKKDFGIDITKDMPKLGQIILDAEKTGGIVLGGGISKHHTIAVNILRGGLDYAVYVTTSSPWDGSLSGARTQEAVSWGKVAETAKHVTVDGDATITVPLIMKGVFER